MSKSEGIRIFLRIRPPATSKQSYLMSSAGANANNADLTNNGGNFSYDVEHSFDESKIHFHLGRRNNEEVVNNTTDDYRFAFRRVFEPRSTQTDVFNLVAKDCVLSVLDGYNSTVFAYGQTGSGKTFSITGGTESYEDRGIIPRALALIYEEVAKRSHEFNWTVSISYLQIYNEKGQDLLNHGKDAKTIEELPGVTVHEGEDEIVLRGLEQHFAPTVTDALNLLFLGDTNRLYCETPMNKTSSRSHCVFTISLEARAIGSSVVRRSKLNLVDLAGSERVSKTGVNGTLLKEAKYINLSLHYLVHVIVALSEQAKGKRDHVPYRNSFMTMVLRDSLGGNCRTSMLATVHAAASVIQETLSTCQFAQRVALIKQHAQVNEETDPLMLVKKLRAEVAQLKDRLAFYDKGGVDGSGSAAADRTLSDDEMALCRGLVEKFLHSTDPEARLEGFDGDLARIYYCFTVLKQAALQGGGSVLNLGSGGGASGGRSSEALEQAESQLNDYREQVDALQVSLQQKENEMNMLFDMLHKSQGPRFNAETQVEGADGEAVPAAAQFSAQMLIRQLRQRGNTASSGAGSGAAEVARTPVHTHGTAPSDEVTTSRASQQLEAHVKKLAEAGALSAAQTAAAEEFINAKKDTARLQEAYDLSALTDGHLLQDRAAAFESFKLSYRHHAKVEATKGTLKDKYEACKDTARSLNASVDSIKTTKLQIQRLRAERAVDGQEQADPVEARLLAQLSSEKETYNALAATLRGQKEEIDAMHAFMKRSQEQLTRDFEEWFGIRQQQLVQATRPAAGQDQALTRSAATAAVAAADVASAPPPPPAVVQGVLSAFRAGSASSAPLLPTPPTTTTTTKDTTEGPITSTHTNAYASSSLAMTAGSGLGALGAVTVPTSTLSRHPSSAPSASAIASSSAMLAASSGAASRLGLPTSSTNHATLAPGPRALPAMNTLVETTPVTTTTATPSYASGHAGQTGGGGNEAWRTSPRPTNPHHLQPLMQPAAGVGADGENGHHNNNNNAHAQATASLMGSYTSSTATTPPPPLQTAASINPYAPQHRSTGNSAADEKLAALYRAREQMRQQFMSP